LTEEQQHLQREIRTFAAREIAPHVSEWDEGQHLSPCCREEAREMGLLGVIFRNRSRCRARYVEYVSPLKTLSLRRSVGIIVAAHNSLCTNHIMLAATNDQRHALDTEARQRGVVGVVGADEPDRVGRRGARTTAVRRDDGWVLNGSKTFITNGSYADCAVVLAVTDREKSPMAHLASSSKREQGLPARQEGEQLGLRASDPPN